MSSLGLNVDFSKGVEVKPPVVDRIQEAIAKSQSVTPVFRSVHAPIKRDHDALSRAAYDFQQKYGDALKALKQRRSNGYHEYRPTSRVIAALRKHRINVAHIPEVIDDKIAKALKTEGFDPDNLPSTTTETVSKSYWRATVQNMQKYDASRQSVQDFIKFCYSDDGIELDDIDNFLNALDEISSAEVDRFTYVREAGRVLILHPTIESFLRIPNDGEMHRERFSFAQIKEDAQQLITQARWVLLKEQYVENGYVYLSQPRNAPTLP